MEINLWVTGTTHLFATIKILIHREADVKIELYYLDKLEEKYYITSDNIKKT